SFGSSTRGRPASPCAKTLVRNPLSEKATVSAPPLRMARREKPEDLIGAFMSRSLSGRRHDGAYHPHVRATAAEIAIERRTHVRLGRLRLVREQCRSAHDDAARAIAALRHLLLDERRLQRMRLAYRAEPLERRDRFRFCAGRDRGQAR